MYSPSQRLVLDSAKFGFDYSVLSKIFVAVLRHVHARCRSLYRVLPFATAKLATFNEKIVGRISNDYSNDPLPDDAARCAFFADGCRFRVARPSGPYSIQKSAFSGDKKMHNHGVQGIMGPDGLFYDIYDGPVGRHNDKRFMRDSKVNARLAAMQQGLLAQYNVYTDKGYYDASHVRCAAHGPGELTVQQVRDNTIMAMSRIGIEWGFGKVKARVPYIQQPRLLKLQAVDVGMRVKVAFILANVHTCLHGSQSSEYFNCAPPTLDTYFSYIM